jgi:hypothetical protein
MNNQIFLVAAIIAALGLTTSTTTVFAQTNGNPHDSGEAGNPHDVPNCSGNPHDSTGGHHEHSDEIHGCPGAQ